MGSRTAGSCGDTIPNSEKLGMVSPQLRKPKRQSLGFFVQWSPFDQSILWPLSPKLPVRPFHSGFSSTRILRGPSYREIALPKCNSFTTVIDSFDLSMIRHTWSSWPW